MGTSHLTPSVCEQLARSPHRVVIAGAGGWIGLATLELLHTCLGEKEFARRVVAFGSSRRTLGLRAGVTVPQLPLAQLAELEPGPTILLHLAFLTKDRAERMDEEEYVRANRAVSRTVLDALDAIGAESVFVASSGAAAKADDPSASPAMRLYGSLKREDEKAFSDWAEASGKRAVVARIFNLSGPYINKHSNYALASFILDALAGRPIEVRATNRVVRSFVALRELMSLVFALLLDGSSGATQFDTGGAAMEMQEIAEAIACACGGAGVRRASLNAGPADEYVGIAAPYAAHLANHGIEPVPFDQQIRETADFLDESQETGWMQGERRGSAVTA